MTEKHCERNILDLIFNTVRENPMIQIINLILQIIIAIVTTAVFVDILIKGLKVNPFGFNATYLSYSLLFLGLGLTLLQLNYFSVMIATLAAFDLWLSERKK